MPYSLFSECQIQAEFYMAARLMGLPTALEVRTPVGRLDIAVFDANWQRLLVVIECKKQKEFSPGQIARYKRLGVPVFGLWRMDRTQKLAAQIKRDYFDTNSKGILFHDQVMKMKRAVRGKAFRGVSGMFMSPTALERLEAIFPE